MNAFFKKFSKAALVASFGIGSAFVLSACGDDAPSDKISLSDSFEMVLAKAEYKYNSKDSTLSISAPICEVSSLKALVWRKNNTEDSDTSIFYMAGKKAEWCDDDGKDCTAFEFEGKSFPRGLLIYDFDVDKVARYGYRFDKKVMKTVYQYDGDCYVKSFYAQLLKSDYAFEQGRDALTEFYKMFLANEDDFDAEAMKDEFDAPNCSELTMHHGDVSIKLKDFKENSGKIVISYKKKSVTISFKIRYNYVEADCKAAYNDYKADKSDEEFNFYDYDMEITDDFIYNLRDMATAFQRDNKIDIRKKEAAGDAADDEAQAKAFARAMVKLALAGMKK